MSQLLLKGLAEHARLKQSDFQDLVAKLPSEVTLIDSRTKLPPEADRHHCIQLCDGASPNAVVGLAFYNDAHHLVQVESDRFLQELQIAAAMIQEPRSFLEKPLDYLMGKSSSVRREYFQFRESREKEEILARVLAILEEAKVSTTVHDAVQLIVDELFTNAIYNAPTTVGMSRRHAGKARTVEVELGEGESAEILLAFDDRWLWVGARDSFGSYPHEKVLCRIYDSFQRGVSATINMGEGGAGIGCRMMYDLCASFTVMIDPGKETLVGYGVPLKHSLRNKETALKHLHMGSTLGGKMGQLRVTENKKGSQLQLEFFGHIDEDANFTNYKLAGASEILLDLGGVTAINSCGIREWIKWIREVPSDAKLTYVKCQKAIVDQINMVDGFLPKGAQVQSFYVPYFCEACETVTSVLLTQGKEFGAGPVKVTGEVQCSNCAKQSGLDVVESQYFRFVSP